MPAYWINVHMSRPAPRAAVDLMSLKNVTAPTIARPPRSSSLRNVQQAAPLVPKPAMKLIPLSVAVQRDDIKRRKEGFEMHQRALHLALMRRDIKA